jgi:hypothetical protein
MLMRLQMPLLERGKERRVVFEQGSLWQRRQTIRQNRLFNAKLFARFSYGKLTRLSNNSNLQPPPFAAADFRADLIRTVGREQNDFLDPAIG